MSESIMIQILGDKVPQKLLNVTKNNNNMMISSKKKKQPIIKSTINIKELFFNKNDFEKLKMIYKHNYINKKFDISSFRFSGLILFFSLALKQLFCSTSILSLQKYSLILSEISPIFNENIQFGNYFYQIEKKIKSFIDYLNEKELNTINFDILLEQYQ